MFYPFVDDTNAILMQLHTNRNTIAHGQQAACKPDKTLVAHTTAHHSCLRWRQYLGIHRQQCVLGAGIFTRLLFGL